MLAKRSPMSLSLRLVFKWLGVDTIVATVCIHLTEYMSALHLHFHYPLSGESVYSYISSSDLACRYDCEEYATLCQTIPDAENEVLC